MPRPLGINAVLAAAVEAAYGITPAVNFFKLPLVSHGLGEEQPLIEDDQLGFGREGLDPTYDVITNDGDVVVPVDTRAIGFWLRQTFGPPVTSAGAGAQAGKFVHVFSSGASSIPSTSIEIGNPEMPIYSMHYGAAVNTMKIAMARSGMLNATLSLIAQGEMDPAVATAAGILQVLRGPRFAQATGSITVDGAVIAEILTAAISYSNMLEKLEVIRSDGRISGVDPGKAMSSGTLDTRFATQTLLNKARGKTPVALNFGWATPDGFSLNFNLPRVFLPKPKRPITGPKGIQAQFNWQASGAAGAQLTATLVTDVASYA
ncbi:phage tail tube protein [Sphingomonas sp. CROZ-RG-20F-R02-07]|uniref:phage tail tube protein n=1 Tax=Sphingomonas sp. CROZ-RG-20F-R02-07 TaxID=2914832 RepID=UPI001F57005D|nr:phage tail tube protein [Sphingomonas sp. CROZ-RG-20F-R02-07]